MSCIGFHRITGQVGVFDALWQLRFRSRKCSSAADVVTRVRDQDNKCYNKQTKYLLPSRHGINSNILQHFICQRHIIREQLVELILIELQDHHVCLGNNEVGVDEMMNTQHLSDKLALPEF